LLNKYLKCSVWRLALRYDIYIYIYMSLGFKRLNRRRRQFSRLLAAEVCASAVIMLDTPCSEVVWRVLATHSIRQFPVHFPSRASPCAITFQLDSTSKHCRLNAVCTACHLHVRGKLPSCYPIRQSAHGRIVPAHAVKACMWNSGIAPLIHDVGKTWIW